MSYASDALIDVLKRENNQLQAENAKLKQELEAVGTAAYLYGRIDLADENVKLRKLVIDFDKCLDTAMYLAGFKGFVILPDQKLFDSLHPRMRELGIEVGA